MLFRIIFSEDISKVGSSFSDLLDMLYGVSQSSILGPLLFNINLCDFFFMSITLNFPTLQMIPLLMNVVKIMTK